MTAKKITLVMTRYEAECFIAAAGEAMDHCDVVRQTLMERERDIKAADAVWSRLKGLFYKGRGTP